MGIAGFADRALAGDAAGLLGVAMGILFSGTGMLRADPLLDAGTERGWRIPWCA